MTDINQISWIFLLGVILFAILTLGNSLVKTFDRRDCASKCATVDYVMRDKVCYCATLWLPKDD